MECANARIGDLGRHSARRRSTRTQRFMATCGIAAMLAVALLVGYVAQQASILHASYENKHAEDRLAALKDEYDRKSLELTRLVSLDRVDKVAREQLGMVDPPRMDIVLVDARPELALATDGSKNAQAIAEPPTVLAGVSGIIQQMAVAAAQNLMAAWFASAPAPLPSVLR